MDEPYDRLNMEFSDKQALSFGAIADRYAQLRPQWPPETAAWLAGDDQVGGNKHVLDLGAGTGKVTETLVEIGHTVVAVDPSHEMLVELNRRLPLVETRVGAAEEIPARDDEFDVITVAQAWHWFEPEAAASECARVLRPNGLLGVAWHRRDERVPWIKTLAETVGRMESVAKWPRTEGLVVPAPFSSVEARVFDYELITTPEGLRALADTWSYVNRAEDRAAKLDAALVLGREAARADGTVVIPHQTHCYRARASQT